MGICCICRFVESSKRHNSRIISKHFYYRKRIERHIVCATLGIPITKYLIILFRFFFYWNTANQHCWQFDMTIMPTFHPLRIFPFITIECHCLVFDGWLNAILIEKVLVFSPRNSLEVWGNYFGVKYACATLCLLCEISSCVMS